MAKRTDIGCNLHAVGEHTRRVNRSQLLISRIVAIQYHHSRPDPIQAFKQLFLCPKIRFHIAVKIQMITAEIRENGNLEQQCLDAFHRDRVR